MADDTRSLGGLGSGIPLILATLLSWASIPLFLTFFARPDAVTGVALIDAWTANGWRYGISAVFWLPLLLLSWKRGKLPAGILTAALVPTAFNAVGQTLFAWCPYYLDPGFFTFVFRVQIVFVALGAWLLFPQERAVLKSPRFWLGIALVVFGSVGLVLLGSNGLAVPQKAFAIAIAIGSGAMFAGYGLAVRYYMKPYPAVLAFGVICQYTAILVVITMLIMGRERGADVLSFSGFNWFMLVSSSLIGIAVSHVTYYAALQRLGIAVSMGIIQLQPVFTASASMVIFGEQLNAGQWTAGLIGVVGALLILSVKPPARVETPAGG